MEHVVERVVECVVECVECEMFFVEYVMLCGACDVVWSV